MRRPTMLFVTILVGLFGAQIAFADGKCGRFTTIPWTTPALCADYHFAPWATVGGGWKSTIIGSNNGSLVKGTVQLTWTMYPAVSTQDQIKVMYHNSKLGDGAAYASSTFLLPGVGVSIDLLGPYPDATIQANGTLVFAYVAEDPAVLDGLVAPWVQVTHISGLAASELSIPSASIWKGSFCATSDGKNGYAVAIGNPSDSLGVIVQGNLYDQNNALVGTQTWLIGPQGATAFLVSDPIDKKTDSMGMGPGFGSNIFQNGSTLVGRIELKVLSPANAVVTPLAFLYVGGGMSSAPLQAFVQ